MKHRRRKPVDEIAVLRAAEMLQASRATLAQFHANRLALIYGAGCEVLVDYNMDPGRWRHIDRAAEVVRHGKEGVLPPWRILTNPNNQPFYVAPDVAEALIARDGGCAHVKGKPL